MPVKKCSYCGDRMFKVIHGLPRQDEFENPPPFTEFAGCIITGLSPDFRCQNCDSKVIKDITPKSGVCFAELPFKQREAIRVFERRVELALYPVGPDPEKVEVLCPHESYDYGYMDHENLERDLRYHNAHGDFLKIELCECTEVRFPLAGGEPILRRRVTNDDDPWDIKESIDEYTLDSISLNLSQDSIEELMVWPQPLDAVLNALLPEAGHDYLCEGGSSFVVEAALSGDNTWPSRLDESSTAQERLAARRKELSVYQPDTSD